MTASGDRQSLERNVVLDGHPPPISRKIPNQEGTHNPHSTKMRILWTPGLLKQQNQEGEYWIFL